MPAQAQRLSKYDLSSPGFFESPEETFARMRRDDPVYFDDDLEAWVLTRYQDVAAALKNAQLSVDRNGEVGRNLSGRVDSELGQLNRFIRGWMIFSDPPRQSRLRGLVAKAFQPQMLQGLRPSIEAIVDQLLDEVAEKPEFEVLASLGIPLAERVTADLLGIPWQEASKLKAWTSDIFRFLGAARASDGVVLSSAEGVHAFRQYVGAILEARRDAPGTDLISQMLRDAGDAFTEEELVGVVITLVVGAYETTAYSIASGLYLLLSHPEQLTSLRAQPGLTDSAVEESLRYGGPAFAVQRRAITDVVLGAQKVKAGERIYCMLHAANHDPEEFEKPHLFDVRRTPCRHLGLGLGAHFCLGAWLTRLETQCAFRGVLERFPYLALKEDSKTRFFGDYALRGVNELVLTIPRPEPSRRETAGRTDKVVDAHQRS